MLDYTSGFATDSSKDWPTSANGNCCKMLNTINCLSAMVSIILIQLNPVNPLINMLAHKIKVSQSIKPKK